MKIKELFIERNWNRDGEKFHHQQILNDGNYYIYEVSYGKCSKWYEVFKRKIQPDVKFINGKFEKVDDAFHVKYPGNNDFGSWAFCYNDVDGCMGQIERWSNLPFK